MRVRLAVIGAVVVGLIFLGSSFCLANGGGPVTKEVTKEAVKAPAAPVVQPRAATADVLKSPGLATLLSVICPGLGQIYNEDDNTAKILIMAGAEGLCWVLIGAADMEEVGYFGLGVGRLVSGVDAYYGAIAKNRGLSLQIDNDKVVLAIKGHF